MTAGTFTLTGNNTGVSGLLILSPIGLTSTTGNYSVLYSGKFDRNTSNLYMNGLRQRLYTDFVEGGAYDLLLSNSYNSSNNLPLYTNDGSNWE